jgi:hypothetical protein
MRARHRHFNPAHAGATAVFDSRFLSGFSDGASVDTWVSRSGSNDISQATAANRPTYETNEINGNPSVFWDGGANDELTFASSVSYASVTLLCVYKNGDATNGSVVFARNNNSSDYNFFTTNTAILQNSGRTITNTHNLGNVFLIASSTKENSASMNVFVNGKATTAQNVVSNANFISTGIGRYGAGTQFNTEGHLGLAVMANVSMATPIRKRCEHAAAYCFKISCN